jgi:hypothetical protein
MATSISPTQMLHLGPEQEIEAHALELRAGYWLEVF